MDLCDERTTCLRCLWNIFFVARAVLERGSWSWFLANATFQGVACCFQIALESLHQGVTKCKCRGRRNTYIARLAKYRKVWNVNFEWQAQYLRHFKRCFWHSWHRHSKMSNRCFVLLFAGHCPGIAQKVSFWRHVKHSRNSVIEVILSGMLILYSLF